MSCHKATIDADNMDVVAIIVRLGPKLVGSNFRKINICANMILQYLLDATKYYNVFFLIVSHRLEQTLFGH